MRLLLQAFRRGMLLPDRPYGITSDIREHIVLNMCGMEDNSDYAWRNLISNGIILAPHYDRKKMKSILQKSYEELQYIAAGYRYNILEQCAPEERLVNKTTSLVELFNRMKKSGIIDAFAKQVAEIEKKDRANV